MLSTRPCTSARARARALLATLTTDPRWSHIRFIRLCSQREVDDFLARVEFGAVRAAPPERTRRYTSGIADPLGTAD